MCLLDESVIVRHLGVQIEAFRRCRGWSRVDLASRLRVSELTVTRMETGVTRVDGARLLRIAQLLGVGVEQFYAGLLEHQSGCETDAVPR